MKPLYIMSPIVRQRLFDLLEQGRQRPCIWVTAAAGYGKTSLLTSYLEDSQEPQLWYALRPADTDLMRFFQHFTQALKTQFPELHLPEISKINLLGPEAFGEVFFTALIAIPLTLVLDDYHHLERNSLVHQAISSGLESLETGRCLIASREPPPSSLTRLLANGVIDLIATDELKFTLEETRQLLTQHNLGNISDDEVQTLYTLSEGWVAGLILLIKQQQLGRLPRATDGLVFGYFRHEVLSQFNAEIRQFLMICALIPDITSYQAAALTGQNNAEQQLEDLINVCAFIKCLPNTPPIYRFHALFRDVLWEMSQDELDEKHLVHYKQHAVQLLIQQGQLDVAVELLVDLKDWISLIGLIKVQAETLLAQGRLHTLKAWINNIPAEIASHVIWLDYWLARCELSFAPAETRQRLEMVLTRFKKVHDTVGIFLTWSYIVESYFIERNEVEPLDYWLGVLAELHQDYSLPDLPSVRARVIYAQYIIVAIRTNKADSKLDNEMINLLHSQLSADQKIAYGAMIIFRISWLSNGRERSKEVQAIIRQLLLAEETSPIDRFVWSMSQIIYDYLFAEHRPSLSKALLESRDIGERHGFKMLWHTYQLVVSQTLCIEGRGSEAEQILGSLETDFCNVNLNNYCHLKLVISHCHLINGRLDAAMDYSEQALQASLHVNPIARAQCWLAIAQVALGQGKRRKVLISLAHVRQISRKIGYQNLEFSARILLASYAAQTNKLQRAENILRQAFSLGNVNGYRRFFMQTPESLERLCAIALNADIYPDYARTLIRANQLTAPKDLICNAWPWPVRIRALGPLKVEINGEALVFQGKAQAKPMAMLKALIFNSGQAVRAEQVAVNLWPEANEQKAKVNIKSTLHRLRKLLGHDVVILREGCLHLNPDCCWLDIIAFRRLLDKRRSVSISTAELEDSLRLYRGPLLQDDEISDSAIHLRLELNVFFVNSVQDLVQRLLVEEKHQQAIDWLLRGLEIEPLSELFALELIRLYLSLNRKNDALVFYHSFRDNLIKELEVEPGDELKLTATALTKNN